MKIVELSDDEMTEALNELSLMTYIQHENLMCLEHSFVQPHKLVMIMKRMEFSGDKLIHNSDVLNDVVQLISYLLLVARGVRFLHRHQIIHRDLKPQNTLATVKNIGSNKVLDLVKVTDFGASKLLSGTVHANTRICTPQYCAPELLLRGVYDSKIDSFSFGVMIGEAACKLIPQLNRQGHIKLTRPDFRKQDKECLFDLYSTCTQVDPKYINKQMSNTRSPTMLSVQ